MTINGQALTDVATAANKVRVTRDWKAASLEFECLEEFEIRASHAGHVIYCAPDNRPSSGPMWKLSERDEYQKCPPYLLLPAGREVCVQFEAGRYTALVFEFRPELLETVVEGLPAAPFVFGLNMSSHQLIHLTLQELTGADEDVEGITQDLAQALLVSAARMISLPIKDELAIEPSEAVDAATEHIRHNIRSKLPALGGMSELTGMSERHLQRKFKDEMRMSLQDYVANYRIEVAKELLLDPQIALKTIAYDLGYTNPSHFTRSFKAATGVAPSEYQRDALESRST